MYPVELTRALSMSRVSTTGSSRESSDSDSAARLDLLLIDTHTRTRTHLVCAGMANCFHLSPVRVCILCFIQHSSVSMGSLQDIRVPHIDITSPSRSTMGFSGEEFSPSAGSLGGAGSDSTTALRAQLRSLQKELDRVYRERDELVSS